MKRLDGDKCHQLLIDNANRSLSFPFGGDIRKWKDLTKDKLYSLLKLDVISKNARSLNLQIEKTEQKSGYRQIRFTFESEVGAVIPCYLLIPDNAHKLPLAVTIQGHTTGVHVSIGEIRTDKDVPHVEHDDFAIQTVQNGYSALAIEMRGMGELRSPKYPNPTVQACSVSALNALNLGRTILGERVFDIMRAIDALTMLNLKEIDLDKIFMLGESGGGTASFYTACLDERIKYVIPGFSFCSYKDSIMAIHHCCCNFIPDIYNYFEMFDLAGLIAPRPMTVVAGKKDDIFPIDGVKNTFLIAKDIYSSFGAEENLTFVQTELGHYWLKEPAWQAINAQIKKLGW